MSINKEKKTNFPDLERLPNTNFWRHLFDYWWNRPRIFTENIFKKYILKPQEEQTKVALEKIIKEKETEYLNEILRLHMTISELKNERKNK